MNYRPSRSFMLEPFDAIPIPVTPGREGESSASVMTLPPISSGSLADCHRVLLPSTNPSHQHLSKLQSVSGRSALLVVVKIDIGIPALFFPGPDAAGPLHKRALRVMTFVTATGTMASNVDKVGRSPPWCGCIMMVRQAK